MSPKSFLLDDRLHGYLLAHSHPLDEVAAALIAETAALGGIAQMQIAPEQGAFMALLASAVGARDIVEVGTFTGYSALCLARALPPDGRLLCLDISEEWTSIGRRAWQAAGVAMRIELRIGPALETLRELPSTERFDLAFIDADKPNYSAYYAELLPRLRRNGLILVDNVLWSGAVVDPTRDDTDTEAIRAFNDQITADPRVESTILTLADGLTLIRKR
ncbi:MAG: class I SAM-dependent methyltransferase [Actinomycetota bacterium]|nr:class I SAM-dependent methyltransferase [Actinomycetota bacterium]